MNKQNTIRLLGLGLLWCTE